MAFDHSKDDGNRPVILSCGEDKKVILWCMLTGRKVRELQYETMLRRVTALSDGTFLKVIAAGNTREDLKYPIAGTTPYTNYGLPYNPETYHKLLKTLKLDIHIALYIYSSYTVWDLSNHNPDTQLQWKGEKVTHLVIHIPQQGKKGKRKPLLPLVVVGEIKGQTSIWSIRNDDNDTKRPLMTLRSQEDARSERINGVAVAPAHDDSYDILVATCGHDRTVSEEIFKIYIRTALIKDDQYHIHMQRFHCLLLIITFPNLL